MDRRARSILEDPTSAELARHIITFDPDAPDDHLFSAFDAAPRAALAPIPWPAGLAPQVPPVHMPAPGESDTLPKADVLVVTWTVAEAKALADVLTPEHPSTAWNRYGHNFQSTFVPLLRRGAPALESGCLGVYCLTQIGERSVLCIKSDLHLSQDGPK